MKLEECSLHETELYYIYQFRVYRQMNIEKLQDEFFDIPDDCPQWAINYIKYSVGWDDHRFSKRHSKLVQLEISKGKTKSRIMFANDPDLVYIKPGKGIK